MFKNKHKIFKKIDISKEIKNNIGLSNSYTNTITDDLIEILKNLIKSKNLNIKNFGTFKVLNKSERIGRNPKNKKNYKIPARKTISFVISKNLKEKNEGI